MRHIGYTTHHGRPMGAVTKTKYIILEDIPINQLKNLLIKLIINIIMNNNNIYNIKNLIIYIDFVLNFLLFLHHYYF